MKKTKICFMKNEILKKEKSHNGIYKPHWYLDLREQFGENQKAQVRALTPFPGSVAFQDSQDAPVTHSHGYLVIKQIWPSEEAHGVRSEGNQALQGPLPQATSTSSTAGKDTCEMMSLET